MNKFKDMENIIDKFMDSLPCQSDKPFPAIKVEKKNPQYARLLLDAYAGSGDSELQAITQYIYHSKTISSKTISNALLCTAMVEMRHLDALGEIITLLGEKPFFVNSNMNFWMTGNIAYVDKMKCGCENYKQKLRKDIDGEHNAINGYKYILKNIDDKYIEKVILKIISDEQVHIKIFEYLLKK